MIKMNFLEEEPKVSLPRRAVRFVGKLVPHHKSRVERALARLERAQRNQTKAEERLMKTVEKETEKYRIAEELLRMVQVQLGLVPVVPQTGPVAAAPDGSLVESKA